MCPTAEFLKIQFAANFAVQNDCKADIWEFFYLAALDVTKWLKFSKFGSIVAQDT